MIRIESVTIELNQDLPSGEKQLIVLEWDGSRVNLCTDNWSLPPSSSTDTIVKGCYEAFYRAQELYDKLNKACKEAQE